MNSRQCINCEFAGSRKCTYRGYPIETIPEYCQYKIGIDAFSAQENLKGTFIEWDKLKAHDTAIATEASKSERERILQAISESLKTCTFYDDMISGEGGCPGKRNCESKCDGCTYFEIDGNQLAATIESLKEGAE